MATGAPDHYKATLLYGLYNGQPTPLACDQQGRLILVSEDVTPQDKSGTILLRDDFSNGLVVPAVDLQGTGADVSLDTTEAITGGASARMTGGSDGGRFAAVTYYYNPSVFNVLGVNWRVRFGDNIERHDLQVDVFTGTQHYTIYLRYSVADAGWLLWDAEAGDWVQIVSGYTYTTLAHWFHTFKLTFDLATRRYKRFIHPEGELDISAYQFSVMAGITAPITQTRLQVRSNLGTNAVMLLDEVICTQDDT